jgi:hypothetical protein
VELAIGEHKTLWSSRSPPVAHGFQGVRYKTALVRAIETRLDQRHDFRGVGVDVSIDVYDFDEYLCLSPANV